MILLSLIVYLLKREEYYYLIARYKEKYLFPAPASFHHMTGFFGAVIVIRFFIRLSHKKESYLCVMMILPALSSMNLM